jgi:hemoglobin
MTRLQIPALALGLFLTAAPALAQPAKPMAVAGDAGATAIVGDATYKAFHETAGIKRIIDDFVVRITTDPRIANEFKGADLPHLNAELVDQVCYLIGGPCAYTGKDMKSAHAQMGLDNVDFNALAEDLQLSMDKEGVGFPAQNRLLAKLAPMQKVIVTK